jgi:hypothetical protein
MSRLPVAQDAPSIQALLLMMGIAQLGVMLVKFNPS